MFIYRVGLTRIYACGLDGSVVSFQKKQDNNQQG